MTLPGALSERFPDLRAGTRTLVMGILNLTPDSFSGDGLLGGPDAALRRAEALVAAGADILDVGGESTRECASIVERHGRQLRIGAER